MSGSSRRSANSAYTRLDPFSSGRVALSPTSLKFGSRILPTAAVTGVRIEAGERSTLLGNVCGVSVFTGLAALILAGCVIQVLPYRTLIAAIALGGVGLACLQDAWGERGNGFYRLMLRSGDGPEDMVFATSDAREIQDVWSRLAAVLPPNVARNGSP